MPLSLKLKLFFGNKILTLILWAKRRMLVISLCNRWYTFLFFSLLSFCIRHGKHKPGPSFNFHQFFNEIWPKNIVPLKCEKNWNRKIFLTKILLNSELLMRLPRSFFLVSHYQCRRYAENLSVVTYFVNDDFQ